jgi:hypothetical protein
VMSGSVQAPGDDGGESRTVTTFGRGRAVARCRLASPNQRPTPVNATPVGHAITGCPTPRSGTPLTRGLQQRLPVGSLLWSAVSCMRRVQRARAGPIPALERSFVRTPIIRTHHT